MGNVSINNKKPDSPTVKLQICPLCGGSGLVETGKETDTCPMCKGEWHSNNHPTSYSKYWGKEK